MKRLLTILIVVFPLAILASIVVEYHQSTKRVVRVIESANTLEYLRTGYLVNPVIPAGMQTNMNGYWVTNEVIQAVPQSVLDAEFVARSNATILLASISRSNAVADAANYTSFTNSLGRILRVFALLTLDQVNTLRRASVPPLAIITTNQFLNALSNAVVADPR